MLTYVFIKYLLINQMIINYCRGVSHKPPFESLPSECDGGTAIVRHGQVSK